jgi:hypothetical protein
MKNINFKSVMVISLLLAFVAASPAMVTGYGEDEGLNFDQFGDGTSIIDGFQYGFGSIFGALGYGGNLLGTVFKMLLMQTLTNFSESQILPGVWVMSASVEENHSFTRTYTGEHEIYTIPYDYNQSTYIDVKANGYAYCDVVKAGSVEVNITIGAAVTLIIWDNDGSFIRAVDKLVSFFNKLRTYEGEYGSSGIPEDLIKEGVSTITWFLIHINDIFTGDELFTINPITWQKAVLTPLSLTVNKNWHVTGGDWRINPTLDPMLYTITGGNALLAELNTTAIARDDTYMKWLLSPTNIIPSVPTIWTTFSFDLIQLWMKNFEIHIDVAKLLEALTGGSSGPVDIAAIFQGLDVEFYLFTHHLAGAFLYNDTNADGKISSAYRTLTNSTDGVITTPDGTPVQVPDHSEMSHRIVLNSVGDFDWQAPHLTGSNQFSWGLDLNNVMITPVPIGIDLESYLGATPEHLDYIHFGFTFKPDTSSLPILKAPTKLDQNFAPWSGPSLSGDYDLGIVYLSTVLHFHLNVAVIGENPADPTAVLDPAQDYNNITNRLSVGNYIGGSIAPKLEFVDIAGENYIYGSSTVNDTAPASSSVIPLALYEAEVERHDTFQDANGTSFQTFATDISLNVSFNVFAYAVCFPEFNGGNGIWHDPTFSVYMIFEAKGFWALILLIAGVGLVGVGTILIKRRKDARF